MMLAGGLLYMQWIAPSEKDINTAALRSIEKHKPHLAVEHPNSFQIFDTSLLAKISIHGVKEIDEARSFCAINLTTTQEQF